MKVNEEKTIQKIKEELEFLRIYEKQKQLIHNVGFGKESLYPKELHINKRTQINEKRSIYIKQGIQLLDDKFAKAITLKYIKGYKTNDILIKMNGIVVSTYNRILKKAYLQLAAILDYEIYEEEK